MSHLVNDSIDERQVFIFKASLHGNTYEKNEQFSYHCVPHKLDTSRCSSCKAVPSSDASADSAYNLASRHRVGYERQGCSRAIDVVLHRGRPTHPDRPDNFSVHLNGKPSSPRSHTCKGGDAS